jgi:hypothetical protein
MPGVTVHLKVEIRAKEREVGHSHVMYDRESRWVGMIEER